MYFLLNILFMKWDWTFLVLTASSLKIICCALWSDVPVSNTLVFTFTLSTLTKILSISVEVRFVILVGSLIVWSRLYCYMSFKNSVLKLFWLLPRFSLKVVDSRPARSAGRVKKVASKPLKILVCVKTGLYYHLRS